MGNQGNNQKLIPIQFPSSGRIGNFCLFSEILVIKGLNPTLPKMADFHLLKAYILKTRLNLRNCLDGGKCIGKSYWPPPWISVWYWISKLQVGVLAILTAPLTVISLVLYCLTIFWVDWLFLSPSNSQNRKIIIFTAFYNYLQHEIILNDVYLTWIFG